MVCVRQGCKEACILDRYVLCFISNQKLRFDVASSMVGVLSGGGGWMSSSQWSVYSSLL